MATKTAQSKAESNLDRVDGKGQSGAGADTSKTDGFTEAVDKNTQTSQGTPESKGTSTGFAKEDRAQGRAGTAEDARTATGESPLPDTKPSEGNLVQEGEVETAPREDVEKVAAESETPNPRANIEEHDRDVRSGKIGGEAQEIEVKVDNKRGEDGREDENRQAEAQKVVPGEVAMTSPTVGNPNGVDPKHNGKFNDPYGIDGDGHITNDQEIHNKLKATA